MAPQSSTRRRIMLVEDEGLIALTAEDELHDAGFEVAGPFASCSDALEYLGRETPDAAVLDVSLRDGPCTELARLLRERGIPFVVYSGSMQTHAEPEFQGVPWVPKPSPLHAIVAALASLPGGGSAGPS